GAPGPPRPAVGPDRGRGPVRHPGPPHRETARLQPAAGTQRSWPALPFGPALAPEARGQWHRAMRKQEGPLARAPGAATLALAAPGRSVAARLRPARQANRCAAPIMKLIGTAANDLRL